MTQYTDFELSRLVDILSEETNHFCDMRANGSPDEEEFAHCWRKIMLIQQAIKIKYDIAGKKMEPSSFFLKNHFFSKQTSSSSKDKR
jgi:hypothetical protein